MGEHLSQGNANQNKDISLKTYKCGSSQDSENLKHWEDVEWQGAHSLQVGMQNGMYPGSYSGGFLQN